MDHVHKVHTPTTYLLHRCDYGAILMFVSVVSLAHYREIDWVAYAIAFAWIDLVGYLPGAIRYRIAAARGERLPTLYYVLYNFTHSIAVQIGIIGIWWSVAGRWNWAMVAGIVHLCGDRAIFGNMFKSTRFPFEHKTNVVSRSDPGVDWVRP